MLVFTLVVFNVEADRLLKFVVTSTNKIMHESFIGLSLKNDAIVDQANNFFQFAGSLVDAVSRMMNIKSGVVLEVNSLGCNRRDFRDQIKGGLVCEPLLVAK